MALLWLDGFDNYGTTVGKHAYACLGDYCASTARRNTKTSGCGLRPVGLVNTAYSFTETGLATF